jgi:hypothetical protein
MAGVIRLKNGRFKKNPSKTSIPAAPQQHQYPTPKEVLRNVEMQPPVKIEGCRILEFDHFARQMFCRSCKQGLLLTNITNEVTRGFSSVLDIQCASCFSVTHVTTSRYNSKLGSYNVNLAAVLGRNFQNYIMLICKVTSWLFPPI